MPKWTSASLLGFRFSISSIVRFHASRSNSGGGVGGQDRAIGLEADTGRIARIEGAVAGEVTDVVACVPG